MSKQSNQQLDLWNRVEKLVGRSALATLDNSTVGIVGTGSLGSWTAVMLAMSAVGRFILVDPDRYEPHNSVRHAADLRYDGKLKVEVVADLIFWRNQEARKVLVPEDALKSYSSLSAADLVIVAGLGSEIVTGQLASLIRQMGKPALFGGVYEKAIAGDIFLVDPAGGPCYNCFASQVSDVRPMIQAKVDYGRPPDELKAQPGLGPDVMFIAAALSKWALRILVNDGGVLKPAPGNYLLLANERYEKGVHKKTGKSVYMDPSAGVWYTIPKLEGCHICDLRAPQPQSIEDLIS